MTPLAQAVGRYVLKADKVHGDDTPIRALGGKGERAHTARLWVYVRDVSSVNQGEKSASIKVRRMAGVGGWRA